MLRHLTAFGSTLIFILFFQCDSWQTEQYEKTASVWQPIDLAIDLPLIKDKAGALDMFAFWSRIDSVQFMELPDLTKCSLSVVGTDDGFFVLAQDPPDHDTKTLLMLDGQGVLLQCLPFADEQILPKQHGVLGLVTFRSVSTSEQDSVRRALRLYSLAGQCFFSSTNHDDSAPVVRRGEGGSWEIRFTAHRSLNSASGSEISLSPEGVWKYEASWRACGHSTRCLTPEPQEPRAFQ